ncbi:MAG TPA: HNH endonuclease, partial [Verrucomicrobiae bacterium]|nr:HNH endonuclease [Verrucomicrobiae bacterium]
RKPCGCVTGSCLKCRRPDNKGYFSAAEVEAMRRDYEAGMTASAVEKKHGVGKKGLKDIFERRGIPIRPFKKIPRQPNGSPVPYVPKTKAELEEMIRGSKRIQVPLGLKFEWRRWPLSKRKAFIQRLREKFPSTRPTTPFSKNVTPFVYGDQAAHDLADKLNAGTNSRNAVISLKAASEGVIYDGMIYFWNETTYVRGKGWRIETGRPLLTHIIYEKHFGKIPPQTLVIQKDGNKNNFEPRNLKLLSMADNARRNQWWHNPELVRGGIARRIAVKSWLTRGKRMNALSRAQIGALLDDHSTGLFEQITRRTK